MGAKKDFRPSNPLHLASCAARWDIATSWETFWEQAAWLEGEDFLTLVASLSMRCGDESLFVDWSF